MSDKLQDMSMVELFRMEAESQLAALTEGLLSLERGDTAPLEAMMRAAHSLKGAGRIVGIDAAVTVAHAMEDCFVAAQRREVTLGGSQVDQLLQGVDILTRIAQSTDAELSAWEHERMPEVAAFVSALREVLANAALPKPAAPEAPGAPPLETGRYVTELPVAKPAPVPVVAPPPEPVAAPAPKSQAETQRRKTSTASSVWPANRSSNRTGCGRSARRSPA